MVEKLTISLSAEQAQLIQEAVDCGDYASSSEVVREALRDWRAKRLLGRLWDLGAASGPADADETIEDIKRTARRKGAA